MTEVWKIPRMVWSLFPFPPWTAYDPQTMDRTLGSDPAARQLLQRHKALYPPPLQSSMPQMSLLNWEGC